MKWKIKDKDKGKNLNVNKKRIQIKRSLGGRFDRNDKLEFKIILSDTFSLKN